MTRQPLKGIHAFVTGGGTGIGRAIARELARLGARLSLAARREATLAEACAELRGQLGAEAHPYAADVTDATAVARAIDASVQAMGPVGILVNNAGAAESAPFLKTDAALLERMLAVNLKGAFLCTQAVAPAMLKARAGRIVNVASTAGLTGYAYVAAYCAAKHALVGLTRALAREFASSTVTVNAVCPGYTETPLLDGALDRIQSKTGRSREAARAELAAANPMGRIVRPEEVATSVGWLCLPESGSVTGQAIIIAGGELMT
jgi:NAD(P)-dependent dehydrogenase (short-subunit alcohol dehydrogenase family)